MESELHKIESTNPDVIAYSHDSFWPAALSAAVVYILILLLMSDVFGGTRVNPKSLSGLAEFIFFFTIITSFIIIQILWRDGFKIDKRTGNIVTWAGPYIPVRNAIFKLPSSAQIKLTREVVRSGKGGATTLYAISISRNGIEGPRLTRHGNEMRARNVAAEIAQYLGWDVIDAIGIVHELIPVQQLETPLANRVLSSGKDVVIPDIPIKARTKLTFADSRVMLEVPSPLSIGAESGVIQKFKEGTAFSAFALSMFLIPTIWAGWPLPFSIIRDALILFAIFSALAIAIVSLVVTNRIRIEAGREGLSITNSDYLTSKTTDIRQEDLCQLSVEERSGLTYLSAITRENTFKFAEGLSSDELQWMRIAILKGLTL